MSITKMTNKPTKSDRAHNALALAHTVQRRRENLHMSMERAADLAGMQFSEWFALEAGWVPDTLNVLRAVADTLEVGYLQLSFLAEVSKYNQIKPV
jgi:transcriptional regulator with XRE-family HTH domain